MFCRVTCMLLLFSGWPPRGVQGSILWPRVVWGPYCPLFGCSVEAWPTSSGAMHRLNGDYLLPKSLCPRPPKDRAGWLSIIIPLFSSLVVVKFVDLIVLTPWAKTERNGQIRTSSYAIVCPCQRILSLRDYDNLVNYPLLLTLWWHDGWLLIVQGWL